MVNKTFYSESEDDEEMGDEFLDEDNEDDD